MSNVNRAQYEVLDMHDEEEALLVEKTAEEQPVHERKIYVLSRPTYNFYQLVASFVIGGLVCGLVQYFVIPLCHRSSPPVAHSDFFDIPGSTEVHGYPPTPVTRHPELFPTNVGYAGATPTGTEAALVATAPEYPVHTLAPHLVRPAWKTIEPPKNLDFDIFKKWGNLSPWYSNEKKAFNLDSPPEAPESCEIVGLHLLHRHGARYPTAYASYGGPARFASKLNQATSAWTASGALSFLNEWTYKLGEEILTPFGRQQLYDLGVSMRLKYGFLLSDFTDRQELPVFRTESQDRMLASAMNFALGFFGWPLEEQYYQSITIEAKGFNNTLAPYMTCPNARISSKSDRAKYYLKKWVPIYLKDAKNRLQSQLQGFTLSYEDIYTFQQLCAYETVALGYSKFCELFTEKEWEGFEYAMDLYFWYDSAFGSPVARVQGVGYVNELLARLTQTPIAIHNTSTNGTLDDNPVTFPLNHNLYVDATHEVVIFNVLTALNLTNLAASGPLPFDHIPENRSFIASQLGPFAANVQFQILSCSAAPEEKQIRILINDAVTPLTGIRGCPEQQDGMCPINTFVTSQQQLAGGTDWEWGCHGDWQVPEGAKWTTTTGDPPKRNNKS